MIHFITGGSGSGKSAYAEEWILQTNMQYRFYLATMKTAGDEDKKKVERHQKLRAGKGFITRECPSGLESFVLNPSKSKKPGCAVLLECMSTLAANELFCPEFLADANTDCLSLGQRAEQAFERIKAGILQINAQCDMLAVVSSEVFSDGTEYSPETMAYLYLLGKLNRWTAERADQVTEVVFGIPLTIKPLGQRGE